MQAGSGSCKCVAHTGHGGLAQFSLNAHRFSFSNLSTLRALFAGWIKRSKLGSRLVSANLVAPACWPKRWLAMAPGKSVLACGRTLVVWKWLPVATLPHYHHTTTLPRCQGRPRWGRPPRSVLGSRQLLLTLGLEQGAPGRRPRRWNLELLLSAKVALFPLIIAEWTKWQGLMWALETLGRSTSRHHQHNNPLLSSFHV